MPPFSQKKGGNMDTFTYYNTPKVMAACIKQELSIVEFIPTGRDNAISRKILTQLCIKNGLIDVRTKDPDRRMRLLVEKARMDYTILNLSDGSGYYKLTSETKASLDELQDLQRYIRQEESRAKATFKNLSMAKSLYEDYRSDRLGG